MTARITSSRSDTLWICKNILILSPPTVCNRAHAFSTSNSPFRQGPPTAAFVLSRVRINVNITMAARPKNLVGCKPKLDEIIVTLTFVKLETDIRVFEQISSGRMEANSVVRPGASTLHDSIDDRYNCYSNCSFKTQYSRTDFVMICQTFGMIAQHFQHAASGRAPTTALMHHALQFGAQRL